MKTKIIARGAEISVDAGSSKAPAKQQICTTLVKKLGGTYASALGINLASMESEEVFKWFLATVLFGDSINEDIAIKTYRECEKTGILSPQAILEIGLEGLVTICDQGDYGSYTFKVATRFLEVTKGLKDKYEGDLNRLHFYAVDETDLENRLRNLAKGIQQAVVDMFLREMRDIWDKAEPPLAEPALLASRKLRLLQATDAASALAGLKTMWEANGRDERRFPDLEAALVKLGKNYCGKKRCSLCPVKEECQDMK